MFIAVLLAFAKNWKQPRCLERWYLTMEYCSATKRNELSSNKKTQRNIKFILLSKRNQSVKVTYCIIPTT